MNASEVIREAKNVLFERGWFQGDLEGPDGTVCTYGALVVAAGRELGHRFSTAPTAVQRFVIEAMHGSDPEAGIGPWNDAPERTFDDVIDALDRAEKIALVAEESDG